MPLAFNGGGQRELIDEGIDGYLWDSQKMLTDKTEKLIKNTKLLDKLAGQARIKAKKYSLSKLYAKLEELID